MFKKEDVQCENELKNNYLSALSTWLAGMRPKLTTKTFWSLLPPVLLLPGFINESSIWWRFWPMDEFCLQEIHMDFVDTYKMCKGQIIWIKFCYLYNKDNIKKRQKVQLHSTMSTHINSLTLIWRKLQSHLNTGGDFFLLTFWWRGNKIYTAKWTEFLLPENLKQWKELQLLQQCMFTILHCTHTQGTLGCDVLLTFSGANLQ